jgi:hypothetical protein
VAPAITAPITSTISSVKNLSNGRVGAAVGDSFSGTGAALKPVGTYAGAIGNTFVNFGRGAAGAGGSLVRGDIGGVGKGAARAYSSSFTAPAENTVDRLNGNPDGTFSPTGFGSISAGNTDGESYRKVLFTTAAVAGGAVAGGAFAAGDAGAAGADAGAIGADTGVATADAGAAAADTGLFGTGVTGAEAAGYAATAAGAAKAATANRTPASGAPGGVVDGSTPLTPQEKLVLGGAFGAALFFVLRRH